MNRFDIGLYIAAGIDDIMFIAAAGPKTCVGVIQ